jgi:hypothetical protein
LIKKERPLGIALLSIFEIIVAIGGIITGSLITGLGALFIPLHFSNPFAGAIALIGSILLISSILWLMAGYGLWHGSLWAWGFQLALSVIGIIASIIMIFTIILISVGILGIIINGLIIFYLSLAYVREFFRKVSPLPAGRPPPQLPSNV